MLKAGFKVPSIYVASNDVQVHLQVRSGGRSLDPPGSPKMPFHNQMLSYEWSKETFSQPLGSLYSLASIGVWVEACEQDVFVSISNGILMYMYKIDVGRIIVNSQTVEYWGHFQVAVRFWLGEPSIFSHVTVD